MNPNHQAHADLIADVNAWLDAHGFATYSAAYHDHDATGMTNADKQRFGRIYSPTALIVRHRPDRLAFHRERPCAFLWEAKTKGPRKPSNETIYIDLVTLIANADVRTGGRMLFIHRNQHSGHECGFWMDALPPVSRVGIPDNKWGHLPIKHWYEWAAEKLFPKVPVSRDATFTGTDDPYVQILSEVVLRLPHWQDLIRQELASSDLTWGSGIKRQKTPGPDDAACEALAGERLGQTVLPLGVETAP